MAINNQPSCLTFHVSFSPKHQYLGAPFPPLFFSFSYSHLHPPASVPYAIPFFPLPLSLHLFSSRPQQQQVVYITETPILSQGDPICSNLRYPSRFNGFREVLILKTKVDPFFILLERFSVFSFSFS